MSPSTLGNASSATTHVPAPIDGILTERLANPAAKLFTVVDLSTVWVIANLYEQDFSRVRVGSLATVTTPSYPEMALQGGVSYIDPQVSADTRTAKLRIEVPNPRNELRLGMYADVRVSGAGAEAAGVVIPRTAVQTVGDRQVVYIVNPNQPGTYTEREVRLGAASGEQIHVIAGVQPGDAVVSAGSFFIRAERERLGLRPASQVSPASPNDRGITGANAQQPCYADGAPGRR